MCGARSGGRNSSSLVVCCMSLIGVSREGISVAGVFFGVVLSLCVYLYVVYVCVCVCLSLFPVIALL